MPIPANLETTCFSNSEITESLIKEYIEDEGYEREDMQEFIETHGEKAFQYDYTDYLHQIEDMGSDVVEAFIEEFSISDVSSCRDAYMGHYRSGAEFAEQMASDCGEVMNPMASWIEIDWEKSWENLSYDYCEYDGHIFSQYY